MDKTVTVTVRNDTEILIETKDKPVSVKCTKVQVDCDEMTVTGNLNVNKDLVVGTGPKTTISGNEITGG
jgi:phage baseplate assembly protein gpV